VVDPGGSALLVSQRGAGANDSVDIAAGAAIITGDDEANQGKYYVRNTAVTNVVFTPAPGTDERIDLVVLQVNDPTAGGSAGDNATFVVVEGSVAGTAVAPAVPDTAIPLAEVLRTASDASITDAMITDRRVVSNGSLPPAGNVFEKTASYTLVLSDAFGIIEMNVATANTLTVPPNADAPFPIGTQIVVLQTGAGQTTLTAGSGVTVNSRAGLLAINGQWSGVTLLKRASDSWVAVGELT
jgi:hypothetical protein